MNDIDIVSGYDAILGLERVWHDVGTRVGGTGAFEQFELVRQAAEAISREGGDPLVALIRRDGEVTTLLPLRRERIIGSRAAVPLVYPLAQYTNVVGWAIAPGEMPPLCNELSKVGLDILLLRKVREDSGLHDALAAYGQSQHAREAALYIDLDAYKTFATYDASFSNPTRRNRRQRRQKLEAALGPLSFDVLFGVEATEAFDIALTWKRDWLAKRGISSPVFDAGAWVKLLRSAVSSGAAVVTALRAGGKPTAIEVGFCERDTYVSYLGAFDPELAAFSPGQEQMLRTIAWCFEQGFSRYDLLAPADGYKRQWARSETSVAIDDYAVPLTHVGRGVAELRRHVRPLARDIYHRLSPEVRVAGGRYGMPAAAAAMAAMCAGAVLAAIE
jgi:CelD/BcsL family acetyltransferase involved in cellulose biosynthesis